MDVLEDERGALERYFLWDISHLVSENLKNTQLIYTAYRQRSEDRSSSAHGADGLTELSAAVAELESSVWEYIRHWGDSKDVRLALLVTFNEIKPLDRQDLDDCLDILSRMFRSGFSPDSLLAAATLERKALRGAGESLPYPGHPRYRHPARSKFLTVRNEGLKQAYADLNLEGIPDAPVEMIEGFLDPYITAHVADIISGSTLGE